jgi:hypothetical protein
MDNKNKQIFANSFAIKKLVQALTKQKDTSRKENQTTEIRNGDWWKDAKITDWGMLLATIALTFGTFMLYQEATNQSGQAMRAVREATRANDLTEQNIKSSDSTSREFLKKATQSADAAKKSADASLLADSISAKNYKLTRTAYEDNKADSRKRFQHDSASLQAQIASLDTVQKQFEISNEPYMQIFFPKITQLKLNEFVGIYYMIANLREIPIQVISQKEAISIRVTPNDFNHIRSGNVPGNINKYVIKESGIADTYYFPRIDSGAFDKVKKGVWSIYYLGEIKYRNLTTGRLKYYRFEMKMNPYGDSATKTEFLYNENTYDSFPPDPSLINKPSY